MAVLLACTLAAQVLPLRTLATMPATIAETSGLIRTGPNRLWTHNDSGGAPELYAIDTTGVILRTLVVRGATNVDWEELTQDVSGNVYIGDFGNNDNNRTNLVILKLPSVDTIVGDSVTPERIDFSYADQLAFPPADPLKNFDMEAFVAFGDSLYLFSKNRTVPFDGYTKLYRLPQTPGTYVAELIDSFYTGPGPTLNYWICGAALNPAQNQLLLVSYARCFLFSCFEGADFFGGSVVQRTWAFTQKEAAAWRDNTHMYLSDELLQTLGGKLYEADMSALARQPMADLGPDTIYVGDTLVLTAPMNPGAGYLWSTGANSATVALTQAGDYWLQVTAANGCTARDTISVGIVAGLDAQSHGLMLAAKPNPFDGSTVVNITLPESGEFHWSLRDAMGNLVSRGAAEGSASMASQLVLGQALAAGIYVLEVQTSSAFAVLRLIRR